MANETKRIAHATITTLSSTIAAMTSGSTVAAAGSLNLPAYTAPADYPDVEFVLTITFATATGIENKVVELLAREIDIDGTADAPVPTATYREKCIGVFTLANLTSAQTLKTVVRDCPPKCDLYLYQESGQTSASDAKLTARPVTKGPV